MVLFERKWLYSSKSGCIGAKFVFGQRGCIRANIIAFGLDVFGQSSCIRAKVVVFEQSCFIQAKMLVFGQSSCIRAKVVVFEQSCFIQAKMLVFGKVVVFEQKRLNS